MLTRCVNVCLLPTSAEWLDEERLLVGTGLGEWGFCPGVDPPNPEKRLFLCTPLQQLKTRPNRTSCHFMYIEILKFASSSLKQEYSSSPLVVPVDGAAPMLTRAPRALCCSRPPSSGLFLLQSFTSTLWQSLRLPTAFWMKNEEQTGSICSEGPIYIESSIKLQMEK